nr:probable ATP-dependent RNA helicase ddx42 [Ipomoea batatas]
MASTVSQSPWVMDTGASHHTVSTPSSLQSFEDYSGRDEVMLGDGNTLNISRTDDTVPASSQAYPIYQSSSSSFASPTPPVTLPTPPATSPTLPVVPMPTPHVPPSSLPSPPSQTSLDQQPVLRPHRERHPNPRYYNAKFINVTTTHPLLLSIKPATISQALQDAFILLYYIISNSVLPRPSRAVNTGSRGGTGLSPVGREPKWGGPKTPAPY